MFIRILFLFLLLGAHCAHADVYKCRDSKGNLTFQQTSCPGNELEQRSGIPSTAANQSGTKLGTEPGEGNIHKNLIDRAKATDVKKNTVSSRPAQ